MADKEYIEREAAEKTAINTVYRVEGGASVLLDDEMHTAMSRIPAANVVEVRHGEWKYHECVSTYDGAQSGYSCSECSAFIYEETFDSDDCHKVFCGNCGARMDGKGECNG